MISYNIISNSSPLIAFIKKRDLELLKKLFKNIIIPNAVYNELLNIPKNLEDEKKIFESAIKDKFIIIRKIKDFKIPDLNLGEGEIEAINLCFEIDNPLLLIDEKKGKKIAKTFNVKSLGTLGVLILAEKHGLKTYDNLLENLEILLKKGFYLSSHVITTFIKKIKS